MLWKTEDTDIHPVALAIWMLILALEDRLPATIAGNAIRKTRNLRHNWIDKHHAPAFNLLEG
jgi:hypothetical protein